MKRVIFCVLVLIMIAFVCRQTFMHITATRDRMMTDISLLSAAAENGDHDEMVWRARELTEYWNAEERWLMHFVRHSHIDSITLSIARLNTLAQHQETVELLAELSVIAWQITHIWESEQPSLKNAF